MPFAHGAAGHVSGACLNPKYAKLETSLKDGTRKWQDLVLSKVTEWCKEVDKEGGWTKVTNTHRQSRALAADQGQDPKDGRGVRDNHSRRGGGDRDGN